MSTIYMVRHGQASFGQANYDRLSELGEEQSRKLGEYWVNWGVQIDAVYTGTLERQISSAEIVRQVFTASGKIFPEFTRMKEFNEYDTQGILTGSIPKVLAEHPEVAALARELAPDGIPGLVKNKKAFQRLFAKVMDLWVDGRLDVKGMETWEKFTARVNQGIDRVMKEQGAGKTVVVFTSGGTISVAAQRALGTSDKVSLELGWMVINGSISEFRYSGGRFSLVTFNETPHLKEPELISHR